MIKQTEPSVQDLRAVLEERCDDPTLLLVSDDDLAAAARAVRARGVSSEDANFSEALVRQLHAPFEQAEVAPASDADWFGSTIHRLMFPSEDELPPATEADSGTTRKDAWPEHKADEDLLLWQEPDVVVSRLDELQELLERHPEIASLVARDLPTLIRSEDEFHWAGQHNGLLLAEAVLLYQTAVPQMLEEYALIAVGSENYPRHEAGRILDKAVEIIRNCRDVIPRLAGRRVAESERERLELFIGNLRLRMSTRNLRTQADIGYEDF